MAEIITTKWNLTAYDSVDMFLHLHEPARQTEWDVLLECVNNDLQTIIESIGLTASSVISVNGQYLILKTLYSRPALWIARQLDPNTGADLFSSNTQQIQRVLTDLMTMPDFKVIDGNDCWSVWVGEIG